MPSDEAAPDLDLRKAWDDALLEAFGLGACSLKERAEALDYEITRTESSLRAGYLAGGRIGFPKESMRRIVAMRQTFDLISFLDRNARDEKLAARIKQLKKAEEYGSGEKLD